MSGPSNSTIVRMTGITKRFGDVLANDRVDFCLRAGEIHALLGENGAGKSTLMNILSGLYRADAGHLEVDGRPADVRSPREALAAGIGMVHQHFMLIKGHTVAENIMLGLPGAGFYLNTRIINREIATMAARYHLPVDPTARIWQLSIGERQRVEILKLLFRRARVLILDEPTSVLTPAEVAGFFDTLRQISEAGGAIVFISHKLEEVTAISDRVTVLRAGRTVATLKTRDTSAGDLAELMVGELAVPAAMTIPSAEGGDEVVLSLEGIGARSDRGLRALDDLSLEIRRGEIFGVLGVAGNGQKELAEVATGLRRPIRGRVRVRGADLTGAGALRFIRSGVAHIPEDRIGMGLAADLSLAENLVLKSYRGAPFSSGPFLDLSARDDSAAGLIRRYGILPSDPAARAGSLSGGNIQRLILARELSGSPCLLVAAYPFQGLDVLATDFLGRTLRERAAAGLAVLLIGEDLDLTLGVSHRVGVLFEGRLRGIMPASAVRLEELGRLMTGRTAGGSGG